MTCLDLFSGTGSVSSQLIARGYNTITLDRDMEADIKTGILNWNYKEYEPNTFKFIWASPPCTEYSSAKTTAPRKKEEANTIVKRT